MKNKVVSEVNKPAYGITKGCSYKVLRRSTYWITVKDDHGERHDLKTGEYSELKESQKISKKVLMQKVSELMSAVTVLTNRIELLQDQLNERS